jgi:hypothetical protein
MEILQRFQESLPTLLKNQGEVDHYFGKGIHSSFISSWLNGTGISLRELIHEFKWQTLVLFKCALLQPKVGILLVRLLVS